jgi:hypothetical protein
MRFVLPSHTFRPARQRAPQDAVEVRLRGGEVSPADPTRCGFHHQMQGRPGIFCGFRPEHDVHAGTDTEVRIDD